jgi:outer membrane receptor for ferrienterochelin and colicin
VIVQGPDGDEISIAGQRVSITTFRTVPTSTTRSSGAARNKAAAFTFNLDAVEEMVVVSQGANAEFGRSGGGFVNVVTKSGTNEFHGSAHYFGKFDALSADYSHDFASGGTSSFEPDFSQNQFGLTFGGPIIKDRAFFFIAYDQQVYKDTKQKTRQTELSAADPNFAVLSAYVDTAFGGALNGEFGSIQRTNDANALLAKVDFRFNQRNNLSIKYNYTNSKQENGTFDVDLWGQSANGLEKVYSHAVNGLLSSVISNSTTNEFRFQWAREDRPRPYEGPLNPATGRPFPDTDISFTGYRIGMPFFLPIEEAYDTRIQLLDNVAWSKGTHLFAGVEWNRTEVNQTFVGFANSRFAFASVDGFIDYVNGGPDDDVVLYLQQAGVGGLSVEEAGTQQIVQNEYALFLQDSWKARPNLTVDYGLRWEQLKIPDPITSPEEVFYAPLSGTSVTNPPAPTTSHPRHPPVRQEHVAAAAGDLLGRERR